VLTDAEQVETVLNVADQASGFLVSRGEGVYGFLHRALQEYFAARYLVDDPQETLARCARHVLDANWREPLTLALGLISQPRYPVTDRTDLY
jgi:predicted NACHT family NTPase